jgi:DNA replicative helicase MCM subunit Mcm2 (Cdc46/Mcm family)
MTADGQGRLDDSGQDLGDELITLCGSKPQYKKILDLIDEFYGKVEYDPTVGFKIDHLKGAAYADMNYLMEIKLIVWDKTRLVWHLSCSPNGFHLAMEHLRGWTTQSAMLAATERMAATAAVTADFEVLIAREGDMLDFWAPQLNPKVEGLLDVKRALLIVLASTNDECGDRGRCHCLLHGDPGSAKSALAKWIARYLDADYCSSRTSAVGLTGDGSGTEVIPGALPRAHRRTLCADEMDKFAKKDRQSALEAMEEGTVHIDVGKHSEVLPAEARLIACANVIEDFSPELIDRFDFKFAMRKPTGDEEKRVVSSIVKSWFRSKPGYDGADLKAYLAWIENYVPGNSEAVRDRTEVVLHMLIDFDSNKDGGIRSRESVLRVGYTIAKINHRDLKIEDILRAIRMLYPKLSETTMQAMKMLTERYDLIAPPKE